MKKVKLNKEVILHINSCILLFIALAFNLSKNDFTLGEFIFTELGINIWSNGTSGLYYPGFISFFLSIIFFIELLCLTKGINKKFIVIILSIALVWKIIVTPVFDFGYGLVRSYETGLACIDYIKEDSKVNYKVDSGNLVIDGNIKLQNFGNTNREFYVKVKPIKDFQEIGMSEEMIAIDDKGEPKRFIIAPDSVCTLNLEFENSKSKIINGSGWSGVAGLVIFNEKEKNEFSNKTF